jgi:hypothetical protein
MLGKTFKGLTDEMLRWQTERLISLGKAKDGLKNVHGMGVILHVCSKK